MIIDEICSASFELGEEENFYNVKFNFSGNHDYKKTFPVENIDTPFDGFLILSEKNNKVQFYQTILTRFNNVISFKTDNECEEIELVLHKIKLESRDFVHNHSDARQCVIHPQSKQYVNGVFLFQELPSFIVADDNNNIKTLIINNSDKIVCLNFLYSIKIIL